MRKRSSSLGTSLAAAAAFVALAAGLAIAKPTIRQATKDIGFKDVIRCKFTSSGKTHKRLTTTWFTRQVECTRKGGVPGKPKIKRVSSGYVEYEIVHGKYRFSEWVSWSTTYLGIPNPKEAEILALVNADPRGYFGRFVREIVGEPESIELAAEPKWEWSSPNKVWFNTVAVFKSKNGCCELARYEQAFSVTLERDDMDAPWRFTNSQPAPQGKKLSAESYPAEALAKMLTMAQAADEKQAQARLDALPKVSIPSFKSEEELALYTYKMLREAKPDELEAYLRRMYSSWFFVAGSKIVMHDEGEAKMKTTIDAALKGPSTYRDQYCQIPMKKPDESTTFYNKAKSYWTRMRVVRQDGALKLSVVDVGMVKGNRLSELQALKDPCPKPLTAAQRALALPKADGKGVWRIGDRVHARWKGGKRLFPGKIADIKGTKALIKYDDGDQEWTTADMLR